MSRSQRRDHPVEVRVDEVLARRRAPVPEQARLDVRRLQWLGQQRVVEQIDLADRQIVRGAPVGVQQLQRFGQGGRSVMGSSLLVSLTQMASAPHTLREPSSAPRWSG